MVENKAICGRSEVEGLRALIDGLFKVFFMELEAIATQDFLPEFATCRFLSKGDIASNRSYQPTR